MPLHCLSGGLPCWNEFYERLLYQKQAPLQERGGTTAQLPLNPTIPGHVFIGKRENNATAVPLSCQDFALRGQFDPNSVSYSQMIVDKILVRSIFASEFSWP